MHPGDRPYKFLPKAVFVLACLLLVLLLSTIRQAVFFSGDGGLKYLVMRQGAGRGVSLQLKAEPWVYDIWNKGFYPFKPPFVYDQQGEKIVSFPPFFQWLTTPFFRMGGSEGLYVIPAISLLLLWLWFAWLLNRLKVEKAIIAAALFALAFCSPLTLYGAIYWEHTLAVLLLFSGIVFLVKPDSTRLQAWVLGCLAGLAAWLRPEALLLWVLIISMVLYNHARQPRKSNAPFVIGSFALVALFFICNNILYGNVLGAHSYQLSSNASFSERFIQSIILLTHLNARQFLFFPLLLIVYSAAIYARIKKYTIPKEVTQLLFIALLFSLIAPFFLPNGGGKQWGPRYFLFLVPIVLVAGAILAKTNTYNKTATLWLLIPVTIYSIYLNSFSAYKILHNDYAYRVKPCLQMLQQDSCHILIVQNQFVAQEFAALFETKHMFLAENEQQYLKLQSLLIGIGRKEWIFLARDPELLLPCGLQKASSPVQHAGDYYFVRCSR